MVFQAMETDIFVQIITNSLSILIITSCLYMKIPQILRIKKLASTRGISVVSVMMEIIGYTYITAYNFSQGYSILTYMEYPVILVQCYVMLYYILKYQQLFKDLIIMTPIITHTAFSIGLFVETVQKKYLPYLVPLSTPLSGFSKISYIYMIIHTRDSTSVSLSTWAISSATNIARIITVLMDSADWRLIINLTLSTVLSLCVLVIAFSYKNTKIPCQKRFSR